MSALFGRWNLDGKPIDCGYLERVGTTLGSYGPDGKSSFGDKNISILHYAFHTTEESRHETQPHISPSGAVITWDGRLDNPAELISGLRDSLPHGATDIAIVAAAYETWGTKCFAKLIGDWALSIWNSQDRSVLLAKDPIGTRHLYYSFDNDQISWSTILDPLVRLAGKTFALDEEYIAGWLSMFPAANLTPCVGVHSVPPSSFVLLRPRKHAVSKYWDFDPHKRIRYHTDGEYEEHFRTVFTTAVQRSLRSDRPVLAELSGGRDSSSIVCVADEIIARGTAGTTRVDTISYFDDTEPNWNERPYFTKVEEKRGRTGWHVNLGIEGLRCRPDAEPGFDRTSDRGSISPAGSNRSAAELSRCLAAGGARVVLSGTGGDEVMGGVPAATPEIADLLAKARFASLAHQLKLWALEKRKPWFQLLFEATKAFFPPAIVGVPKHTQPAVWLNSDFTKRHRAALTGYPTRLKLFGPLPSFQENVATLDGLRRQLTCTPLPSEPLYEHRYPYLDRDLLEFLLAIPREQLIRPVQRRSLMRRALVGIVPDEILNRRGKAFVARAPLLSIAKDWDTLSDMTQSMVCGALGVVTPECFAEVLYKARRGEVVSLLTLMRTIRIERWIRRLDALGIVRLRPAL
jgi:asparagine synthase (glutamine-hydrolysing)